VPVKAEVKKYLQTMQERLYRGTAEYVRQLRRRLETILDRPLFTRPAAEICERRQQTVDFLSQRLFQAINNATEQNRSRLKILAGRLETLSPLATLARGYSICTRPGERRVIASAKEAGSGEKVQVKLHRGRLLCLVEESVWEEGH